MAQLFKRRSNAFAHLCLLGLAGLLVGTIVLGTAWKFSSWQTDVGIAEAQPVPFSHKHHVGGLGIDCRYCHTSVTKSAFAGMPPTHTCMTCHSQIWNQSPMLKPVRDSFARGIPLQWNRVYRIPKFVYFDHSIHVNKGVGCTTCHGQIEDMPLIRKNTSFYMRQCVGCHREPERYLRPKDEVFDVHWQAPSDQMELGRELVRKYDIPRDRLTDCYTCHR